MADLYFYDRNDESIAGGARRQSDGENNLLLRGITSFGEALNIMDEFIRQGRRFSNVFFNSHGAPGVVGFPNGSLTTDNAHELSMRRAVVENEARVLFMGCSVADTDGGWRFLDTVGQAFLTNGFVGGSTVTTRSGRGGIFETRIPRWGILRIVQIREGLVVRHAESTTLLARIVRWLTS